MNTITATEAKAHFSEILDRVNQGEEFVLTRHGKGAAYLKSAQRTTKDQAARAFEELVELRQKIAARGRVLDKGETIKSLIAQGRR